jgi:hypothetical protein
MAIPTITDGKTSVRDLRDAMYHAEVQGISDGDKPLYHIVLDNDRFLQGLGEVIAPKKKHAPRAGKLDRARDKIVEAIARREKPGKKRVRLSRIRKAAYIDMTEVPVVDPTMAQGTVFQGQETPIIVFRSFPGKDMNWQESITRLDLEFITQTHPRTQDSPYPALMPLENMFIEAMDCSPLNRVARALDEKETGQALKEFRSTTEFVLDYLIQYHTTQGNPMRHRAGPLVERARKEGLLSESDYRQAKAFLFMGNSAVHHEFLSYNRAGAVIAYHWLKDLVDRTMGLHRLPKTRANGTSFATRFEISTEGFEYKVRRAVFDQLQALRGEELASGFGATRIYLPDNNNPSKEEIMEAATKITIAIAPKITPNRGEQVLLKVMDYWYDRLNQRKTNDFTPQDSMRAALFAYNLFYISKDIDPGRLEEKTPGDRLDQTLNMVTRRKGMTQRRYDQHKLHVTEKRLLPQLALVEEVALRYFPEYITKRKVPSMS